MQLGCVCQPLNVLSLERPDWLWNGLLFMKKTEFLKFVCES